MLIKSRFLLKILYNLKMQPKINKKQLKIGRMQPVENI